MSKPIKTTDRWQWRVAGLFWVVALTVLAAPLLLFVFAHACVYAFCKWLAMMGEMYALSWRQVRFGEKDPAP